MKQKAIYISSIIVALFAGIIGTVAVIYYIPKESTTTDLVYNDKKNVTIEESDTIQSAISKVYDAVYVIESYRGNTLVGTGTGFAYKKDDNSGYIVTNQHVVENSTSVRVINSDGEEIEAKVLGTDVYADIAVLAIDATAVKQVAILGDSTESQLGDTVFTVGSPMGSDYRGTVTKGILSGKDRTVTVTLSTGDEFMMELLQTDAAINPGNSGGPLVNMNGEVIGMNSLKLVKDEIEGMGFAIPIEIVESELDALEKGEEIQRPVVGIETVDVSNTYTLLRNRIRLEREFDQGIVIVNVEQDTPAESAGLKSGDVIVAVDGTEIKDAAHFKYLIYKAGMGNTVTVEYYRGNDIHEATIKLTKSL